MRLDWRDNDPRAPWTPWGPAQTGYQIAPGVVCYSTAGHGGLMVAGDAIDRLSAKALRCGMSANGAYWYEEDCKIAVALYDVPEWHVSLMAQTGGTSTLESCLECIRRWDPEYLEGGVT